MEDDPKRFAVDCRYGYIHDFFGLQWAVKRMRGLGKKHVGMTDVEITEMVIENLDNRTRALVRRVFPDCDINMVVAWFRSEIRRYHFYQNHLEKHLPWHRRNYDWSVPAPLLRGLGG